MAPPVDVSGLMWAIGLLLIPVVLAIPMKITWQYWIGSGHEGTEYRGMVRQIIDSGRQLSPFRATLDDLARGLRIAPSRQRLIEADLLHPLSLSHFLILPALIIFPLAVIVALPVIIIGFPFLFLVEYILIKNRVLMNILKLVETWLHWQVIHIPKPHRGAELTKARIGEFSQHVVHFAQVPQGTFLGLFAWLMVHWTLKTDSFWVELSIAVGLYIFLLGILSVINNAFESDLVFVDPSKGRLVPVDQWLESILKPIVGIGLLFLIGRNLLDEARGGNPVLFATTVLSLLYGAAIVGIAYRWGYSLWRGTRVKSIFEAQIVEGLAPLSYDLTRNKGRIDFRVRMTMQERMQVISGLSSNQMSFDELQNLPTSDSADIIPANPME
ncbi:MAG: hypothetical protein P8Q55_03690 [Candidatus Poseidoniaceae archaeon]|nr:hypothetical protein [Candidatus Poseidoniaceae archaeon]